MGLLNLFKPKADSIKGVIEGTGTLAKDIRQAITGDNPELDMMLADFANRAEEQAHNLVLTEMNGSWLQKNWRPILALVCITALFIEYVVGRIFTLQPPTVDPADLWPILIGLITYRTVEKTQGVRNALGQS